MCLEAMLQKECNILIRKNQYMIAMALKITGENTDWGVDGVNETRKFGKTLYIQIYMSELIKFYTFKIAVFRTSILTQ